MGTITFQLSAPSSLSTTLFQLQNNQSVEITLPDLQHY
ncbi:hypothetical protein A1Q2_08523 (mitochondrion) [Trichosporon asahii var. asahii CBS 8904]|uniref:Uncharacterized protein n=1 Tax=Trichosporon asahii var. asahii (strain CBS 8904) TaxID=1220162 RepID=K1V939_TRIAC|nr:hypothetical protein A1Q2_08523 [Trichosporon asahii var. asahii CBS 8904]